MGQEDIADLSFKFRLDLMAWQSMLQQAQQMYQNFRQMVERPMAIGGGSMGGGGGMAGGSPTVSSGPGGGLNVMGTSTANVAAAVNAASQNAAMGHSRTQAAPQAAAGAIGYGPMALAYGMQNSGLNIRGAAYSNIGAGGVGGLVDANSMLGIAPLRQMQGPMALAAGLAANRRVTGVGLAGLGGGNVTAGGVGGLIGPHDPLNVKGVQGSLYNPLMEQIASATNGIGGGTAAQFGDAALGGKKQSVLTNFRALIFSTIYGLAAESLAKGAGAYSQYNAAMTLTGSNQGAQALVGSQGLRNLVGSIPFAGSALSALAGAAGLNAVDAQVQLASQQDAATAAQSSLGIAGRTSIARGRGTTGGTFTEQNAALTVKRINARVQSAQQTRAALEAWDLANPEPKKGVNEGLLYDLGMSTPIYDAANAERSDLRTKARTRIAQDSYGILAEVDLETEKTKREQKYQIASAKNDLQMATMENRFRPMAAKGAFAVSQFGTERGRLGPNANAQDYEYLATQGNITKEDLRGAQRDLTNNLIFGKALQYNPYTISPMSMMERSTETNAGGFNALQEAIDKLTAAINSLPKSGGPQ